MYMRIHVSCGYKSSMYESVSSFFDVSSWSLVTATVTLISIDRVVFWHGSGLEYVDCTVLLLTFVNL